MMGYVRRGGTAFAQVAADDGAIGVNLTSVIGRNIRGDKTISRERCNQGLIRGHGPLWGTLIAPVPFAILADIPPKNPLDMTITRVGRA